jgi:polyprenyl P-hydroxybenzoate/phenylacrylic acid decarboxylase-like protein
MPKKPKRIIVAISGASGAVLAVNFLNHCNNLSLQTHLIISAAGEKLIDHETDTNADRIRTLAAYNYEHNDLFAGPASGTFKTDGMVIVPCSVKTLSFIATGHGDNLIARAADVSLKQRRRLILVVRESPLNLIHIANMKKVTQAGAIVLPPVLAFYTRPQSVEEQLDQLSGKILDSLGIEHEICCRWK